MGLGTLILRWAERIWLVASWHRTAAEAAAADGSGVGTALHVAVADPRVRRSAVAPDTRTTSAVARPRCRRVGPQDRHRQSILDFRGLVESGPGFWTPLPLPGHIHRHRAPSPLPSSICRLRVQSLGALTSPSTQGLRAKADALQALCGFWAQNGRDVCILASLVRHVYTHQDTGP